MINYLPIEKGNAPLMDLTAQPDIRDVALTVTERGFCADPATNASDAEHDAIKLGLWRDYRGPT